MSITASDLVLCPANNDPLDDTSPSGGSPDLESRLMGTILDSREKLEAVSDGADVRLLVVHGINFGGERIHELFFLKGTSVVKGLVEFRSILLVEMSSADPIRTVSLRRQSDSLIIMTIDPGVKRYTTLFKYAFPSEAVQLTRYEKIFIKNTHANTMLHDVRFKLVSDPSGNLAIAPELSLNDAILISNRFAVPSGLTFHGAGIEILPNQTLLPAGSYYGIWVRQTLDSNERPAVASSVPNISISGTVICGS